MGDQYQNHPDQNNLYLYTTQGDWTPHSAVSSFNYQLNVDSSLITPISMPTQSPVSQGRAPIIHSRRSPNDPSYQHMYLNTSQQPRSQTAEDTSFSVSPYVHLSPQPDPPTPYFGSFGVSGPATTYSQPPPPPDLNRQTPILSEPRPRNRQSYDSSRYQPTTPQQNIYHQQSPQSGPQTAWLMHGQNAAQETLYESYTTIPPPQSVSDTSASMSIHTSDNEEEESWEGIDEASRLLLTLKQEGHSWKEIARIYEEKTGRPKRVAALQMAHNRLQKKIKAMNEHDVSAVKHSPEPWEANKWRFISAQMLNYGDGYEFWDPPSCGIKWEDASYEHEYAKKPTTGLGKRNRKNVGVTSRKRSRGN